MIQYVLDVINMINIKTPRDILNYMDNIEYGYIGLNGEKHINSLKGFRKNYRTLSIEQILEYKIDYMIDDNLDICEYVKDACTSIYFKDGPVRPASSSNIVTVNNWGEIYRYFYNQ